jgi:hypothetical protein
MNDCLEDTIHQSTLDRALAGDEHDRKEEAAYHCFGVRVGAGYGRLALGSSGSSCGNTRSRQANCVVAGGQVRDVHSLGAVLHSGRRLAGVWKKHVHPTGYSEWIMFDEKIPAKE